MRKLCPNLDREDGLETVLEVPIPEEMFSSSKHSGVPSWQSMKSWMRSQLDRSAAAPSSMTALLGGRNAELQILLGVTGAPLVPFPVRQDQKPPNQNIKDHPIESSMAKYIVQQYRAAVGGERALDGIDSVYAMGRVKMGTAEFCGGDPGKEMKLKSSRHRGGGGGGGAGEVGSFVLWQKRPDLWSLELVLSGCKISAGSDGHVAWRQTPWHLRTHPEAPLAPSAVHYRVLIRDRRRICSRIQ
ncbi:hypothetical protein Sjap_013401 [Stephania japonica]|uniref:Uncharacterized protein n=1 Tax=Stephania japonica TaxID=461633 RepID=A0AAP0IXU4_9MAGN